MLFCSWGQNVIYNIPTLPRQSSKGYMVELRRSTNTAQTKWRPSVIMALFRKSTQEITNQSKIANTFYEPVVVMTLIHCFEKIPKKSFPI